MIKNERFRLRQGQRRSGANRVLQSEQAVAAVQSVYMQVGQDFRGTRLW